MSNSQYIARCPTGLTVHGSSRMCGCGHIQKSAHNLALRAMSNTYRDLKVWQRSIDLAEKIYRLTAVFPASELYGLTAQMRRAAVSIASNIAEGWGRHSRKDYSRYVEIAGGSNDELRTQLVIAERLGFGEAKLLAEANTLTEEIGRMLGGLYRFLQTPRKR